MPVVPFHEIRFTDQYAEGASVVPMFNTIVIVGDSGFEQRVSLWQRPRLKVEISYVSNPDTMNGIRAFFMARAGRTYGFRFRDNSDYEARLQPLHPTTALVSTVQSFQMKKTYTDSINPTSRLIQKPKLGGTVNIYSDGVLSLLGRTVDETTGIVTISGISGSHTWTYDADFDVPVRFDTDEFKVILDTVGRYTLERIGMIELLLPAPTLL